MATSCSIDGCSAPAYSRGWCVKHYARWRRHGDPTMVKHRHGGDIWSRLEGRFDRSTGCWLWTGATAAGYGVVGFHGRNWLVHRLVFELRVGPIPEGHEVDHLCRNPLCANPDHLEAVTAAENVRRSRSPIGANGRKTHCVHGHEFTPENTLVRTRPQGGRACRACGRERDSRRSRAA